MSDLDPRSTALVLIDLQKGIVGTPLAPRSGDDVLAESRTLAERFRAAGAPVVLICVAFAEDFADAPSRNVDQPMPRPQSGMTADWTALADGLAGPKDILIVKRQWGAFYGTELDLQLRRRGVKTIVLGGTLGRSSPLRETGADRHSVGNPLRPLGAVRFGAGELASACGSDAWAWTDPRPLGDGPGPSWLAQVDGCLRTILTLGVPTDRLSRRRSLGADRRGGRRRGL